MSVPYYYPISFTYSTNILTINYDYHHLAGGGTFSVLGFPQGLTFSISGNTGKNIVSTYSISLSASTTYNLTFKLLKAPYYQIDAYGVTANSILRYGVNRVLRYTTFTT